MPSISKTMRRAIATSGIAAVIFIAATLITSRPAETAIIEASAPLKVTTLKANHADGYSIEEAYSGQLKAHRSSQLGFEQGGLLIEIQVDEGDRVETDQLLAQLDTRRLKSKRAVLEAQITSFEAGVREAKADTILTKATAQRHKKLSKLGKVSRQSLEESVASANRATARKQAAQARLQQARAELDALKVSLELAELRAPYGGRIATRSFDEGAAVSAGQTVLTLIESEQMEAHVGIPQRALPSMTLERTYELTIDGERVMGRLSKISPKIDPLTRTVNVIFKLDKTDTEYRDGQAMQLRLRRRINQAGFWVPISALAEGRRGLWTAYALAHSDQGALLETRALQVLHTEATRVFVKGTLQDGEQLVSAGLHRLVAGQRVESTGGVK